MRILKIDRGIKHDHRRVTNREPIARSANQPDSPGFPGTRSVAYFGCDYGHPRPQWFVKEGQFVQAGEKLFSDKGNPAVNVLAHSAGTVSRIKLAKRRLLDKIEIETKPGSDQVKARGYSLQPRLHELLTSSEQASVVTGLIEAGLFSIFRTRPFDEIPLQDSVPDHLFVAALDTHPLAPDPRLVLDGQLEHFNQGLDILTTLTDGFVYVCQSQGLPLATSNSSRISNVAFSGAHPAGNASTHIHRLYPVNRDRLVWTVDYRDVAALGQAINTGHVPNHRTVSVYDANADQSYLINAVVGSDIGSIVQGTVREAWCGNTYCGAYSSHLHRFDRQLILPLSAQTALVETNRTTTVALSPGNGESIRVQPLIAEPWLEDLSPLTNSLTLLLRALICGDIETAEQCGSLRFVAEDIAPVTALLNHQYDFAALLTRCNEQILAETDEIT